MSSKSSLVFRRAMSFWRNSWLKSSCRNIPVTSNFLEIEEQNCNRGTNVCLRKDKRSLLSIVEVPPIVDSQVHRKFRGLLNLTRPVLQTMSSGEEHVSSDLQQERKVLETLCLKSYPPRLLHIGCTRYPSSLL